MLHTLSLLLALGCATTSPPVPAEAPAAAPPAAPEPSASPVAETVRLVLDPAELQYDEAAGTAIYSPDSRRKAAEYTTWTLDLASLEAVLGGRPLEPVTVMVEASAPLVRVVHPEDPNMPAPLGGFHMVSRTGRVLSRAE